MPSSRPCLTREKYLIDVHQLFFFSVWIIGKMGSDNLINSSNPQLCPVHGPVSLEKGSWPMSRGCFSLYKYWRVEEITSLHYWISSPATESEKSSPSLQKVRHIWCIRSEESLLVKPIKFLHSIAHRIACPVCQRVHKRPWAIIYLIWPIHIFYHFYQKC